jgi:hypothetical protein
MMAMQRLLVTMLMLLSFAAVALTVPALGARMASNSYAMSSEHGSQRADADAAGQTCQELRICEGSDAFCYALCSGATNWLAPASPANAAAATAAIWAFPETPNRAGLGPARNERPPNDGLAEREWPALTQADLNSEGA